MSKLTFILQRLAYAIFLLLFFVGLAFFVAAAAGVEWGTFPMGMLVGLAVFTALGVFVVQESGQ